MEYLRTKSSFILHLYRVKMITIMESLNTKYIVMTLVKKKIQLTDRISSFKELQTIKLYLTDATTFL